MTRKTQLDKNRCGPLISVIVAVYNGSKTLQRCIDSIANQTHERKELIIIDGSSLDGSVDIIQANNDSIAYWESEPDRGIFHAWNKALEHTHGEWICFLGSDDYFWSLDVLEKIIPSLCDAYPAYRVVYGQIALVDQKGGILNHIGEPWSRVKSKFRQVMSIPHPGLMHHRSLFETHGFFDEAFKISGDYEFLLRELRDHDAFFVVDFVVAGMQVGGISSISSTGMQALFEVRRSHQKLGYGYEGVYWWFRYFRMRYHNLLRLLGEKD